MSAPSQPIGRRSASLGLAPDDLSRPRRPRQAASSRISKRPSTIEATEHLVREFGDSMTEAALFLTHIHTLEVSIWREGDAQPTTLRRLQVRDVASKPPQRQRLHELVRNARHDMSAVSTEEHCMELRMVSRSRVRPGHAHSRTPPCALESGLPFERFAR